MELSLILFLLSAAISVGCYPSLKVIGGRDATLGEFPHIVSLQRAGMQGEDQFIHMCAGIILNSTHILTTAECLYNREDGHYRIIKVVAGAVKILGGHTKYLQEVGLGNITYHPKYQRLGKPSPYNLAVAKLNGTLELTGAVKAADLPGPGVELGDNVELDFAGWGAKWCNEPMIQNNLQIITFPIINNTICNNTVTQLYQDVANVTIDSKLNLCTGPLNNRTSLASFGDNGGPLILNDIAYGIHSWEVNYCSLDVNPGVGPSAVFVKLSSFVQWITENVDDL